MFNKGKTKGPTTHEHAQAGYAILGRAEDLARSAEPDWPAVTAHAALAQAHFAAASMIIEGKAIANVASVRGFRWDGVL